MCKAPSPQPSPGGNLLEIYGLYPVVAEVEARLDEVRPDVHDTWAKLLASLSV